MKTYYIFRHGQTFATTKNSGYGLQRLTAGILESGKPTIIKMAEFLKDVPTDLNLTSPILRCRQTAEIITLETGKKFMADWRITEMMEPFQILKWRVKNLLNQLEKSDFNTILICTHGAVIEGLVSYLMRGNFKVQDVMAYPPPAPRDSYQN